MTKAGVDYQAYLASREWALRREAVRERSNNTCERCFTAPMQAVHHRTYANCGAEPLCDLQAICNPCHAFLSGKTGIDPLTAGVRVYLAGPITDTTWRDEILLAPSYLRSSPRNIVEAGDEWGISAEALVGGFDFTGPWFEETGGHSFEFDRSTHGCAVLDNHRQADEGRQREVANSCLNAIDASDVIYCWLPEDSTPLGTMWELGYATAMGKLVVFAEQVIFPDPEVTAEEASARYGAYRGDVWWFARVMAVKLPTYCSGARGAWDRFLEKWPTIRRDHAQQINRLLRAHGRNGMT